MLVYTRDMITAIVQARGDITTVHKLTDIVKDHVSGNFNDVRVSHSINFSRGVVHRVENGWGLTKMAVVLLNGLLW